MPPASSRPPGPVPNSVPRLSAGQVLAWRMARQGIHPVGVGDAPATVRALAGVQAQVQSWAELGVALRQRRPRRGEVAAAIASGSIMRTWAMRGTLHLLDPGQAGSLLALLASGRRWQRPVWQAYYGLTPPKLARLTDAVTDALDGRALERRELIDEIARRTGSRELEDHLRSGWSGLLKPLAWQGRLCHGPSRGGHVTFVRPDQWLPSWTGLPPVAEAARVAIPAYLRAHGPASVRTFRAWMDAVTVAEAGRWFELISDLTVPVEVDGEPCLALEADLESLRRTRPARRVRLTAGFDHYVLGPGTSDARILPAHRRRDVSRASGWISPLVLEGGRVAGVWKLERDSVAVTLFGEHRSISPNVLASEARRIARITGRPLALRVVRDRPRPVSTEP